MKKTTKVATVAGFAIVGAIAATKLRKKKKNATEQPAASTDQRPDPNPETDLFI